MIKAGNKYRHYKNRQLYEVICVARHTETHEEMVIYKGLYHCDKHGINAIWVRPLAMFIEYISENIPRFELIENT